MSTQLGAKTGSTPRKKTSSHHSSQSPDIAEDKDAARRQSQLLRALDDELESHIWRYSADEVARMLSPRKDFDDGSEVCLIDNEDVTRSLEAVKTDDLDWPISTWGWDSATGERDYYAPLALLLNHCITQCDAIYDSLVASGKFRDGSASSHFILRERTNRYPSTLLQCSRSFTPWKTNFN